MSRLVDPIHFFDSHGKSMLTRKTEEARIKELEGQVAHLKSLLTQTVTALKRERAKERNSESAN